MNAVADLIGEIPYRLALAGGWIDQPFVSKLNPTPPGSMVVVAVEPTFPFMERAGIATGTRKIADRIWGKKLPNGDRRQLVKDLYAAENQGRAEPSGSQDMIGLIYPGVCRLDYDYSFEGGYFPRHIECCTDPAVCNWVQSVIHILPVAPRPDGYNPLGEQHLDVPIIQRLGQTGKDCFDAIIHRDVARLGRSMNTCMECWEALMPDIVHHKTLTVDLVGLMKHYQSRYPGAMYSGCGGGYLFIVSEEPVPGTFQVTVRTGAGAGETEKGSCGCQK